KKRKKKKKEKSLAGARFSLHFYRRTILPFGLAANPTAPEGKNNKTSPFPLSSTLSVLFFVPKCPSSPSTLSFDRLVHSLASYIHITTSQSWFPTLLLPLQSSPLTCLHQPSSPSRTSSLDLTHKHSLPLLTPQTPSASLQRPTTGGCSQPSH